MPEYTHDFKLEFNGNIYEGEIEFNDDGIASYKFSDSYNLKLEQMEHIGLLMGVWHKLFHSFGNTVQLVKLKEKAV